MTTDHTRRRLLYVLGAVGLGAAAGPLAGCSAPTDGGDTPTEPAEPTPTPTAGGDSVRTDRVEMTDELTFVPEQIEVSVGTTVTWENVGTIGHTVTAYQDELPEGAAYFASGGFDSEEAARDGYPESGNIAEGETFEHTFETAGEHGYFCIPHELNGMVGTVRVT